MNALKYYFVTDERLILNDVVKQGMTKEQLLNEIALCYEANSDEDYLSILKGLSDKVASLNDEELDYIISTVPLEVAYSEDDLEEPGMLEEEVV